MSELHVKAAKDVLDNCTALFVLTRSVIDKSMPATLVSGTIEKALDAAQLAMNKLSSIGGNACDLALAYYEKLKDKGDMPDADKLRNKILENLVFFRSLLRTMVPDARPVLFTKFEALEKGLKGLPIY